MHWREGHGVPAEPLNSLKYNQPLSLLGQLPGRAETLASPPAGALQPGQEPATGGQQECVWRGATVKSNPRHKLREGLPAAEVSRGLPRPPPSPRHRSRKAQWARGHSCNLLSL